MFPLFHLCFLSPSSFPMFNFLFHSHYFIFLYQWLNGPSSEMIASNLIQTDNQVCWIHFASVLKMVWKQHTKLKVTKISYDQYLFTLIFKGNTTEVGGGGTYL